MRINGCGKERKVFEYIVKNAYRKILGEDGGKKDEVYHNLWHVKVVRPLKYVLGEFFLTGCLLETS